MNTTSATAYIEGVLSGNRRLLAKTITLIESRRADHQALAREILDPLLPRTGKAARIGITGVPGVGKSTFIESFGTMLIEKGHRVAVLAVDPSSSRSGGSVLADKTRMEQLAVNPGAYIRPSPAGDTLGGVAARTREAMLVCEAAGFDVIIVETVGVGQSETAVANMVDFFLVLMLAGAGDELQGIKKGVLELADGVAVNKADGDNIEKAKRARQSYETALHFMQPAPPASGCSFKKADRQLGTSSMRIVSGLRKSRNSPVAQRAPALQPAPKPTLVRLRTSRTSSRSRSPVPSGDALSTTIISKSTRVVRFTDSTDFMMSSAQFQLTYITETSVMCVP